MTGHSWLFTKKRGSRRTGSRISGLLAELLFAMCCFLSGIVGLVWIFFTYIVPEWKVHGQYVHTVCTIEDARVVEKQFSGENVPAGSSQTPANVSQPVEGNDKTAPGGKPAQGEKPGSVITDLKRTLFKVQYKPEVLIRYEVNGVTYKNWTYDIHTVSGHKYYESREEVERMIADLKRESQYHCWYDPENPERVVLISYWTWEHWFSLMIPISLIILGGGMFVHLLFYSSLGSREYSAATAQRTAAIAPFQNPREIRSTLPNVPDGSLITDSPGVHLAYRLPMDSSSAWKLILLMIVAGLWNVCVLIQVAVTVNGFREHAADWMRLFFTLLFAASGGVLVWVVLKQIRSATKIGQTFVEIDRFPIRPGDSCGIFVSQGGRLRMYWLNVMLACEEEVIFTHGTNTRREVQRVFQKQLFCEEGFRITNSSPFECLFTLTLPEHAMHSFVSPRNRIKWQIIVQGAAEGCPVFERIFPLVVFPPE